MLGSNMFAYCLNNPVNYKDVTGTLPAIIIPVWEYWIIHRKVQEYVAFDYGFAMEVYVQKPDGRTGRLDLYDAEYNEYYEVKSIGAAYAPETSIQMDSYNNSQITDWRFTFFEDVDTPSPGTNSSIEGSFEYSIYTVTYRARPGGLIVYTVDYNPAAIATVALGVAAMVSRKAGGVSRSSLSKGIPSPAFSVY